MFHVEHRYKRDILVFKAKDYIKNNEEFSIYKDSSSGILWTDVPDHLSHKSYYDPLKYTPHSESNSLFQRVYKITQKLMFYYKRLLLGREIINSKRTLDFGSGDGAFFKFMSSSSFKIDALDPLFKAIHIEQKNFYTKIEEVPDNQYDMVFMWHSLEHVQDLVNTINEVYKKLTDNGTLVVAVPNHKSFDASCYKENWAALDVPRHLWHFSTNSIKKSCFNRGLKQNALSHYCLMRTIYHICQQKTLNRISLFYQEFSLELFLILLAFFQESFHQLHMFLKK